MTIEELRAKLREKSAALASLKAKALAEDASAEDRAAFRTQLDAIKVLEAQLGMAEEEEAIQAKHSQPASTPAGAPVQTTVPAQPAVKMELGQKLALATAAVFKAGKSGQPLKILANEGFGQFADELSKKAVNTLNSSEGGILVPTALEGGIIPLLRAEATFLRAGPLHVQLVNGKYTQPRGATGASASYVAQGALKPVSQPSFDSITMSAKKLAGIVPITNEAQKWTVGNIEAFIRADLQSALALTMDLNAYFGTGAGVTPTGILNKAGVQTVTPTFAAPTAPTLAELDAFANAMILKLTTANLYATAKWFWLMPYRTALKLSTMRVGSSDGALAFPEMDLGRPGGPQWKGFPVLVTNQVATNGGGTTDETTISLIDFAHVLFGDEEGITMKMSDQATLLTGAATAVSDLVPLWQSNMSAILAEMEHDFGLRYAKAVVKASGIRF